MKGLHFLFPHTHFIQLLGRYERKIIYETIQDKYDLFVETRPADQALIVHHCDSKEGVMNMRKLNLDKKMVIVIKLAFFYRHPIVKGVGCVGEGIL